MLEREPQNSERINIHERGGLTSEHWNEIVHAVLRERFPNSNQIRQDITNYGMSVINGEIKDKNFNHRLFPLGARHWHLITRALRFRSRGLNSPLRFINRDRTVVTQEALIYSELESKYSYSLDDFLADRSSHSFFLVWDEGDHYWHSLDAVATGTQTYKGSDSSGNEYYEDDYSYEDLGTKADIKKFGVDILEPWLLTFSEVGNPIEKSLDELEITLKEFARTNTAEIRNRIEEGKSQWRLPTWDNRDRTLIFSTSQGNWDVELMQSVLRHKGVNLKNPESVATEMQRIYKCHFSIYPYALFQQTLKRNGSEVSYSITLAATRQKAESKIEGDRNRSNRSTWRSKSHTIGQIKIIKEGEINAVEQLPSILIGHLEELIPEVA